MRSHTPLSVSVCFLNGSSGVRIALSLKFAPSSSGQKSLGTIPLGLNTKTIRCFRLPWLANPRLGRLSRNGTAAALMPRSRTNSRRVWVTGMRNSRWGCSGVFLRLVGSTPARGLLTRRLLVLLRQRTGNGDFHDQLSYIEAVVGKRFPQFFGLCKPVGTHRLLHEVMERLLGESVVRLGTRGDELREFPRTGELRGGTGPGVVTTGGIHELVIVLLAVPTDRVEVFQREPQRVQNAVAPRAGHRLGLQPDALARGQTWVQVGRDRRERLHRWPDADAEQPSTDEHPAVDRRGFRRVGQRRQNVWVSQRAGAFVGFEFDFLEPGTGWKIRTVELRQFAVEVYFVREEQLLEVRVRAAQEVVEKQFQRRAKVGREIVVEPREPFQVFRQLLHLAEIEPRQEELAHLDLRPRVCKHPFGLLHNLFARAELVCARRAEQLLVGRCVPQCKRQPRRDRVLFWRARRVRVEETRGLQYDQHDPLHRELRIVRGGFKLTVDEQRPLGV